MGNTMLTLRSDRPTDECIDQGTEAFENLPEECKRIDPEKEIELQKWILRMILESV